jgi:type III restriction enzyme
MKLRPSEEAKTECARKFFARLSEKDAAGEVTYDVVTDYGQLMSLFGGLA